MPVALRQAGRTRFTLLCSVIFSANSNVQCLPCRLVVGLISQWSVELNDNSNGRQWIINSIELNLFIWFYYVQPTQKDIVIWQTFFHCFASSSSSSAASGRNVWIQVTCLTWFSIQLNSIEQRRRFCQESGTLAFVSIVGPLEIGFRRKGAVHSANFTNLIHSSIVILFIQLFIQFYAIYWH